MTTPNLRALGAVRLSRLTDETTSPERQRERIRWWASGNDAELVATTDDLDVSGAVSPFERDGLGPWLTDTPPEPWNVLVSWKLDRISRSAKDTLELLGWCLRRDKRIVCVDDGIDTATQMGRVWIQLAAIFAEVERTNIRERSVAGREAIRLQGRYGGGQVPYGYRVERYKGGARLVLDPPAVEVIRRVMAEYLGSEGRRRLPAHQIAQGLTADGIASPQDRQRQLRGEKTVGAEWHRTTVIRILTGKPLLGHSYYQNEPVVVDGEVVEKGPPIITLDDHYRLVAEHDGRGNVIVNRKQGGPFAGIAYCNVCERDMHQRRQSVKDQYYYCPNGHTGQIRNDAIYAILEENFLGDMGDKRVREQVYVPAEDHTAELRQAVETLDALQASMANARSQTVRDGLAANIAALDAKVADLEELPSTPARVEYRELDRTYADEWQERNETGQLDLLRQSGVRLYLHKGKKGEPDAKVMTFRLYVPMEGMDTMAAVGSSR